MLWLETYLVFYQLFLTVHNFIVPFIVSDGDITRLEPPICSDRVGSGSGIV